jgi:microcystin-dependent protein
MRVAVKIANANSGPSTLNVNGLGAHSIKRATGASLNSGDLQLGQVAYFVFDGAFWQIINFLGFTSDTTITTYTVAIPFAVDTGAVNALVGVFSPSITTLGAGLAVLMKVSNTNSGPVTLKPNALSAQQLVWPDQSQLAAGDITSGGIIFAVFDGAKFQLLCRINAGGGGPPTGPTTGVPGTLDMWPLETPPTGAYECNGQSLSRVADSRLFGIIGTKYGAVDASSFNVPDLRGEFIRGWSHSSGVDPDAATRTDRGDGTGGDHVGTKQADQYKSHTHTFDNTGGATIDFGPDRGPPPHPTGTHVIDPTLAPPANAINYGPVHGMLVEVDGTPSPGGELTGTSGSKVLVNKIDGLRITGALDPSGGNETRPKNVNMMIIIWR